MLKSKNHMCEMFIHLASSVHKAMNKYNELNKVNIYNKFRCTGGVKP